MNASKPEENPYEAPSPSGAKHTTQPDQKQLTLGHWLVAAVLSLAVGVPAFFATCGGLGILVFDAVPSDELSGAPTLYISLAAGILAGFGAGFLAARHYLRSC